MEGGPSHVERMDELTPQERFHGLPDDPEEQQRVLEIVRKRDPDARLHLSCSPPTGTLLEVHNLPAAVLARMVIADHRLNRFDVKR